MHANTTQGRSGHLRPLAATVMLLGMATAAQAGLANGGFEVNTLTSIGHVVGGSFPANSAVWGQESSTITGAMDGELTGERTEE